jgi:diaminopropionate ammonia-lyase
VPTPEPFLLNEHHAPAAAHGPRGSGEVREFHRTLPGYAETPLVSLPAVAAASNLRAVLVKDESSRLGLPAFKMLGASWAVHRALQERAEDVGRPMLVTATDGNHGRAVARMAKLLGLPATVLVPRGVSEKAISLIREEGATVEVLELSYDDTVQYAAEMAKADDNALLVQDTSWPGYEEVPQWIVDGYATLFDEAADQAAERGLDIDLLVVPAGVGSLAHAAVLFAGSRPRCRVVTVEPTVAACISASLAAGALTTVPTGETSMAGLNCGTPAYLAWPDLRAGLAGAVTVDDQAARDAMAEFAALGVDSGPCGSASLAALHTLAAEPARAALGLTPESVVLLLNTEGSGAGSVGDVAG